MEGIHFPKRLKIIHKNDSYNFEIDIEKEFTIVIKIDQALNPYYWLFKIHYDDLVLSNKEWCFFGSAVIVSNFIVGCIETNHYRVSINKQLLLKMEFDTFDVPVIKKYTLEFQTKSLDFNKVLLDHAKLLHSLTRMFIYSRKPHISEPISIKNCLFQTNSQVFIPLKGATETVILEFSGIYKWELLLSSVRMSSPWFFVLFRIILKNENNTYFLPSEEGTSAGLPSEYYKTLVITEINDLEEGKYLVEIQVKTTNGATFYCNSEENSSINLIIRRAT